MSSDSLPGQEKSMKETRNLLTGSDHHHRREQRHTTINNSSGDGDCVLLRSETDWRMYKDEICNTLEDATYMIQDVLGKERTRLDEILGKVMEAGKEWKCVDLAQSRMHGVVDRHLREISDSLVKSNVVELCDRMKSYDNYKRRLETCLITLDGQNHEKMKRIQHLQGEVRLFEREKARQVQRKVALQDKLLEEGVVLQQDLKSIQKYRYDVYESLVSLIHDQTLLKGFVCKLGEEGGRVSNLHETLKGLKSIVGVKSRTLEHLNSIVDGSLESQQKNVWREQNEIQWLIHRVVEACMVHLDAVGGGATEQGHQQQSKVRQKEAAIASMALEAQNILEREQCAYDQLNMCYTDASARMEAHSRELSDVSDRIRQIESQCQSIGRSCGSIARDVQVLTSAHLFPTEPSQSMSARNDAVDARIQGLEQDIYLLEQELERELKKLLQAPASESRKTFDMATLSREARDHRHNATDQSLVRRRAHLKSSIRSGEKNIERLKVLIARSIMGRG